MGAVGLLGGTFNPPHRGHLALAAHAREELGLSSIELVPAGSPPHKHPEGDPGPAARLQMCRLLAAEANGIEVNPFETDRNGPSFTVDTLAALHASRPDDRLWFILGADTARTIAGWREPRRILDLCDLAVAGRSDSSIEDAREAVARVDDGASRRLRAIEMPAVDISSSRVRERVAAGLDVAELTGPAVAEYIDRNDLYRGA